MTTPPNPEIKVRVVNDHRTMGDVCFAVSDATKRAATALKSGDTPERIGNAIGRFMRAALIVSAIGGVLVGGITWAISYNDHQYRMTSYAEHNAERAAKQATDDRQQAARRAVIDLLDVGTLQTTQ